MPLPPEPVTPASSPAGDNKVQLETTHVVVFIAILAFVWLMKTTCDMAPWTALQIAGCAAAIVVGMFATRGITKKIGVVLKKAVS